MSHSLLRISFCFSSCLLKDQVINEASRDLRTLRTHRWVIEAMNSLQTSVCSHIFPESIASSTFSEGCVILKVINHEPRLLGLKELWLRPPCMYLQAMLEISAGCPIIQLNSDPVYLDIP